MIIYSEPSGKKRIIHIKKSELAELVQMNLSTMYPPSAPPIPVHIEHTLAILRSLHAYPPPANTIFRAGESLSIGLPINYGDLAGFFTGYGGLFLVVPATMQLPTAYVEENLGMFYKLFYPNERTLLFSYADIKRPWNVGAVTSILNAFKALRTLTITPTVPSKLLQQLSSKNPKLAERYFKNL